MNELSLFSGAGGGLLTTKHLLGWTTIGYVEIEPYCQQVIAQRIRDGYLDEAPIFGDIRTFIGEGYAESYKGVVDVITAGFPCQPFSVAGKQRGQADNKNLWPETLRTCQIIKPQWIFLENVPGILASSHGYFGTILQGLVESRYSARWDCLPASAIGANHIRDRFWCVAYTTSTNARCGTELKKSPESNKRQQAQFLSDSSNRSRKAEIRGNNKKVPISTGIRCETNNEWKQNRKKEKRQLSESKARSWWIIEPKLDRVVNGMAHRVDRLKAIGNGQVPAVVEVAWKVLSGT